MQKDSLELEDLENLWTQLAEGITAAGPEQEAVFLTKLAILLANELGDYDRVAACIQRAGIDQRPSQRIMPAAGSLAPASSH